MNAIFSCLYQKKKKKVYWTRLLFLGMYTAQYKH